MFESITFSGTSSPGTDCSTTPCMSFNGSKEPEPRRTSPSTPAQRSPSSWGAHPCAALTGKVPSDSDVKRYNFVDFLGSDQPPPRPQHIPGGAWGRSTEITPDDCGAPPPPSRTPPVPMYPNVADAPPAPPVPADAPPAPPVPADAPPAPMYPNVADAPPCAMYPNVADAPPAPVRFGYPTVANNSFAIPPSPAPAAPALFAAREPNKACKLFLKSFLRRSIVSVDRQHLFNDWRRQDEDIFDVRAERVELDPRTRPRTR